MQQTFSADAIQQIIIADIDGDLSVRGWDQQTIMVECDAHISCIQPEGNTFMIKDCEDSLELSVPFEIILRANNIHGDVLIENIQQAELNNVHGDININSIHSDVSLNNIGGDVTLNNLRASVNLQNIGGNASLNTISGNINIGDIGGDVALKSLGGEVNFQNIGHDLDIRDGVALLHGGNIGGDCVVQDNREAEIQLKNVGGDLVVSNVSRIQIGNVGGDCVVKESDNAKAIMGNIGGDLHLQTGFPVGSSTRLRIGGDAHIVLPQNAHLAIRANVGGRVSANSAASSSAGNVVNLIYGEGTTQIELSVGGDLSIRSHEDPHHENGQTWWDGFGPGQRYRTKRHTQHARERAARFNIRSHGHEWHIDHEHLENIIAQASSAAAEGLQGALEAVEQALKNLNITPTPFKSTRSTTETKNAPTEPTTNSEQDRKAILHMIAEGRITPDEGDMLLEALGG